MFSLDYCNKILKDNKEILEFFNVKLIDYLHNMQHLIDCKHYKYSFNLPFYDKMR